MERSAACGMVMILLDSEAAPAAAPKGVYAMFAQRKHLALRVRLWLDHLKHSLGDPGYWLAAGR